uniref:NADH dehydrogenase subunit 6 n=1 Tax=Centropristis striata TaxID=184440 RepID=UPI0028D02385|nr:NADH dehydrogenase subunit 6 [Centropristis striata]WMY90511.1 NADH dehydrogenase subunit 6 [Centropristis striata]
MFFFTLILLLAFVLGLAAVASNPSPYFAALGLVVSAGAGCGILAAYGGLFLSLVLFMIYLGGMLVVFAYSAALAADPFPESLGSRPVLSYMVSFVVGTVMVGMLYWEGWHEVSWVPADEQGELCVLRGDIGGVARMYLEGGGMLLTCTWALLVTLFGVLVIARPVGQGVSKSV